MSPSDRDKAPEKRRPEDRPIAATVLNPVVGLSVEDLARMARDVFTKALVQPSVAAEQNARLLREWTEIMMGRSDREVPARDRRFAGDAWRESPIFRRTVQSWLAWRDNLDEWVDRLDMNETDRRRAHFFVETFADSVAPTNFLLGNPEALERARETRGTSLIKGFRNYLDDLIKNGGMPSQVDKSQFEVGKNIANTPGAVVWRNEMAELIQYTPTTKQVTKRPVFIVPPQINKYYLYDMSPEKSFVKHAVDAGIQVFVISWRNPQKKHKDWGLDEYVKTIEAAIDATLEITGADGVNGIGACAGGITFVAALGYLTAIEKHTVNSMTLMVNVLVQEKDDSLISLFTTEESVAASRRRSARAGVLQGDKTARVFSWMRPNDLIWNYVVSNYLNGKTPPAFDVLFWNADTTNLPAQLHSDFLDFFRDNPLLKAGALEICGQSVDLSQVPGDLYITGGSTDHITPWQACYRSTQLFTSDVTFMLSTAGHIQSVVNPPKNSKRKYFLNESVDTFPEEPEGWLEGAQEYAGSWWPHWYEWIHERSDGKRAAKKTLGNRKHKPLCDAPGTYVLEKA